MSLPQLVRCVDTNVSPLAVSESSSPGGQVLLANSVGISACDVFSSVSLIRNKHLKASSAWTPTFFLSPSTPPLPVFVTLTSS